jgi:hypothetical protein
MRSYRKLAAAFLVLVCFVALGCTKKVVVPDEVQHEYTYAQALKFFNDNLESYTYYLAQQGIETQRLLVDKVDPVVQEANTALDNWGKSLNDMTRRQAYLDLERQMVRLFLMYAVPLRGDGGV